MPVVIIRNSDISLANPVMLMVIPLTVEEAEDQGIIPSEITVPPDDTFSPNRAGG